MISSNIWDLRQRHCQNTSQQKGCAREGSSTNLGVGEATVLKDLEHHVEDVRVGLLDLIEEHHSVRPAADSLQKQSKHNMLRTKVNSQPLTYCCL